VRLIRNPLGVSENQVLLETCDIARRTLHCSIGECDGVHAANTVETTWQWEPSLSKTGPKVKQYCMAQCSTDPNSGVHQVWGHVPID
jgi:hypothetical protein